MSENTLQNGKEDAFFLGSLVFLATAVLSYLLHWTVESICWGVWLSEVVLGAAIAIAAVVRILLDVLEIAKLRPEDRPPDYEQWQNKVKDKGSLQRLFYLTPTFLVIGFMVCCIFGFYAFYGVALCILFPVPLPQRTLSILNMFILMWDLIGVLLPKYWPMVIGTILLKRALILRSSPGQQVMGLADRNLLKMHFSLLLLPPLALVLQQFLGTYQSYLTILLLFIFYYPWENHWSRKFSEGTR